MRAISCGARAPRWSVCPRDQRCGGGPTGWDVLTSTCASTGSLPGPFTRPAGHSAVTGQIPGPSHVASLCARPSRAPASARNLVAFQPRFVDCEAVATERQQHVDALASITELPGSQVSRCHLSVPCSSLEEGERIALALTPPWPRCFARHPRRVAVVSDVHVNALALAAEQA